MHVNFVENLLKVYKHQKQLIEEFFKGDQNFMGALDKACSYVINYRTNDGRGHCRSPELLAKYCDALLKKSSKGINETEVRRIIPAFTFLLFRAVLGRRKIKSKYYDFQVH